MKGRTRLASRLVYFTVAMLIVLSEAAFAQSASPNGTYGFLINSSFSLTSPNPTGLAVLGVMNFDGAGTVTGPYTYEVDANRPQAAKTTTGTFVGTYSSNPDGTGSMTMNLDSGITVKLAMVTGEAGHSLQLVATDFQFPPTNCACNVARVVITGIARAAPAGSLNGSYSYALNNSPNVNASVGVATFDGAGNLSNSLTFVGASDGNGQAQAPFGLNQPGTYIINSDGTGTITLPAVPDSNRQTYAFVTTDNGAGMLLLQTDRAGSGVASGIARLQ